MSTAKQHESVSFDGFPQQPSSSSFHAVLKKVRNIDHSMKVYQMTYLPSRLHLFLLLFRFPTAIRAPCRQLRRLRRLRGLVRSQRLHSA